MNYSNKRCPSENKHYRSNGNRHLHSWSIINKEDLFDWMLDTN